MAPFLFLGTIHWRIANDALAVSQTTLSLQL